MIEGETLKALERGAVFFDLHRDRSARLDVFTATIRDGLANVINRRLFVVQTDLDGTISVHDRQGNIYRLTVCQCSFCKADQLVIEGILKTMVLA